MAYNMHFDPLPLGAIRPEGWLMATLKRQAGGLTGLLENVPPRPGFKVNPISKNNVWLGGNVGRDYLAILSERAPYYIRGLVSTAYVLDDDSLKQKALEWIYCWFSRQDNSGNIRAAGVSDYEWWPRMLIVDAIRFYYEATKDMQAISFLNRYFHFQKNNLEKNPLTKNIRYYPEWRSWASFRGGDNMASVAWLYRLNEDRSLLTLARMLDEQTFPWEKYLMNKKKIHTHGVNLAHGLRKPAIHYQFWPEDALTEATREGLRKVMQQHGQVGGSIAGDEQTSGKSPVAGTELCTIVELLRTFATMLSSFGSPFYGDALEKIAFNALPAAIAPDFMSHQYFSQPNQIYCTAGYHGFNANRMDPPYPVGPWYQDALTFGAPAGYPCCLYNFHLGWPLFVSSMWMKYRKDGLAALAYGPCRVETEINGVKIKIIEKTNYPFSEEVRLDITCEQPVQFVLLVRIPDWCREAQVVIGDEIFRGFGGSFLPIRRIWQKSQELMLTFPMEAGVIVIDKGALAVERGPLSFALNPEEQWVSMDNSPAFPNFEIVPAAENPQKKKGKKWEFTEQPVWNYGFHRKAECAVAAPDKYQPEDGTSQSNNENIFPWASDTVPVKIFIEGHRINRWGRATSRKEGGLNAGALPGKLVSTKQPAEKLTLIPYGAARLRISMFPEIIE